MRSFVILLLIIQASLWASPESQGVLAPAFDSSVTLTGETAGAWRWRDVADQPYSTDYQNSFSYPGANVTVSYNSTGYELTGHLSATGLKPHFAYQFKLLGTAGTSTNERIGYRGRWWQEEWDGTNWINGWNLNNKGDGIFPTPNDTTYDANKSVVDATSPTGFNFKHTAYRVFTYFVTDASGAAEVDFIVNNCYHVLWKEVQLTRTAEDGPVISHTYDVDPATETAYSTDHPSATANVFGEWERLPADTIELIPGDYTCEFILTEESFHGNYGVDPLVGQWALAMKGNATFTIWAPTIEPDIELAYLTSTFPDTVIGTEKALNFSIRNLGTADLLLTSSPRVYFIGGATANFFAINQQPTSPIATGNSAAFSVTYKPFQTGTHEVTMRISSNDPDTPDTDIVLTGKGVSLLDDDEWDDKIRDSVKCGLQSGTGGGAPFYLIVSLIIGICLFLRRRTIRIS